MKKSELILLIDDDEINNFINEAILKSIFSGIDIISYTNPLEALSFVSSEYIKSPVPCIAFLDINMPQMNGWEFLEELNQFEDLKEYLTVYMISSSIDLTDKNRSLTYPIVEDFVS